MAEKDTNNWLEEILPKIQSGVTIKVHQKIKEKNVKGEEKERIQIFEGIILAHKGGKQKNATITVRKVAAGGIGVEKIFPIYSPNIAKMEFVRAAKVRRAKLNFLPNYKKKLKDKKKVS
ncbi:50S ribosomal protein L19 [Candidatus Falkowbacteria bacterium]|uniref:50S ribosomal protein L19 n=1 Tax=Candidatus Buchananbacteria bacterium CG10_big_fil_rev_8_21_14_0_10_33_19 TaxID=1974525 RepID=A0A2H0W5K3_9BACT|nr:50S ribosomal protein L19 [Candidatus Falkowbacteria bacterium]PIS06557.1 MAG: 50S ribosomal protein L19 [Candidatus Buchananbacteria bacterium CG10_big_fil_rev_8_21_14_0_10_33_19]